MLIQQWHHKTRCNSTSRSPWPQYRLFCPSFATDPGDPGVACGGGLGSMRKLDMDIIVQNRLKFTINLLVCINS